MRLLLSIFCLFLVTSSLSSFKNAPPVDKWDRLGSRVVNYRLDRDVIRVTGREGSFSKLKIQVTGGPMDMHKIVVQYSNGKVDNIPIRKNFGRRGGSRVIDLRGGNRSIRDVTFFYDTDNRSRTKAKVHLFAR
ncbi:hypothetical protein HX109_00965 [Galbibacter sp. BG1]|uniref:hypothetical protein n=1 Tax=Galbibacter sp. BG1 TaxID=1170699 RepID=UPI0015BD290C|nr:hypothetical protein [Galbibacter sp. BG1]QLE00200.1 hypothetical protein HX109_00965 [Galbibacter sp. BG1]